MSVLTLLRNLVALTKTIIINFIVKLAEGLGLVQGIEYIITSKNKPDACKNRKIEKILRDFPNDRINSLNWDTGDETEAADTILVDASVRDYDRRYDLSKNLARSMRQIRGYQKLCQEVEARRLESYNSFDEEHETELLRLWKFLQPDIALVSRKTNQWQEIGFQGDDPSTDFRGMGILGLDQLVFFAQYDVDNCKRVFSLSLHPRYGFPFAICGIAITAMVKVLLSDDLLKNHFYNAFRDSPSMDSFHQVYCRVFTLFAEFWELNEPTTIMDFNPIKHKFVQSLKIYLEQADANLLDVRLEQIFCAEV